MHEQLWLRRGFRWWQSMMTIVLMSVTVASADNGTGGSATTDESVQLPEPTGEEEESEQASEASSREELLRQLREEKSQQLSSYEISDLEARTRRWEKAKFPTNWLVKGWHGFRPVIGGMPSGSGTVFGGGYIHGLDAQYVQFQINGRYSTRGYTMFDGQLIFPPPQVGRRIEFKLDGAYRDLTSLRFYGLGNDSDVDDRSTYLLRDKTLMGSAWLNPRGLLSFGAQGGIIRARTGSGDAGTSLEENFDPEDVPGFGPPETEFLVYGGWAEFDIRSKWEQPHVGIVFRLTALRYEDRDLNQFDFSRVIGDVKAYIPLGPKSRVLAIRVRAQYSDPDDGHDVPFYLMETVGGAKSIRGFNEWRFRDRGNLLMSAEYRWEIWTHVDLSFFVDAGKVFFDTDDLDFDGLHTGYGFGLRAHAPGGVTFRMDIANSIEGFKFHIGGGPSF